MTQIDDYLNSLAGADKAALTGIRQLVKDFLPDATEAISYGMPAFKYQGKYLIGYYAFKDHLSIFPGAGPVAAFAKELSGFKTSKGTVQFTAERPLPRDLLEAIIRDRQQAIELR